MDVVELSGTQLDLWVARALGEKVKFSQDGTFAIKAGARFDPSARWALAGPIIDRARISIMSFEIPADDGSIWTARNLTATIHMDGPTPLVAAMRVYVASKFGDEVPDEPAV